MADPTPVAAQPDAPDREVRWLMAGFTPDGTPRQVLLTPDLRRLVTATVYPPSTPTPPPATAPEPRPGDIVVHKGDDLSDAAARLGQGRTLYLERGGVWPETLVIRDDGVRVLPIGVGNRPTIKAEMGIILARGVKDLAVDGLALVNNRDTGGGNGIRAIVAGGRRWQFTDLTIDNFMDNVVIHHPKEDQGPMAEWNQDVRFVRCRLTDAVGGPGTFDGQGAFVGNVAGLLFDTCLIDNNGWLVDQRPVASIWRHGLYIAFFNSGVILNGNILSRNVSYGAQVRSPADNPNDMTIVTGNLCIDNAIGLLVNGTKAQCQSNVNIPGHYHTTPGIHGQGALTAHVGAGSVQNNLSLGGPAPVKGKQWRMPAFTIAPREREQGWEWNKPVNPTTANNVSFPDLQLDLTDIIRRARSGEDIGKCRDEGMSKAREVAAAATGK
jgi:hypothetical protein